MPYHRPQVFSGVIACALSLALASISAQPSQTAATFPLELDHVLVWVTKGAPEARALEDAGLQLLGEASKHTGQGTASKVFAFENAYLELIWVDDEQAAAKNAARTGVDLPTRARWRQTGASPFGVGLHRLPGNTATIPFPVIEYWSEWMKPDTSIQFARDVSLHKEPMYFVVPGYLAIPDAATRERLRQTNPDYAKMMRHRLGISKLTKVVISTNEAKRAATADSLTRNRVLSIERGKAPQAPLMELTFDGGAQGKTVDLRPQLPLLLRY